MILVDSSVWIDYFNGVISPASDHLDYLVSLRSLGFTIRKTIDVVIATWCIQTGNVLLHSDRDFLPFVENLGLKVVPLSAHN